MASISVCMIVKNEEQVLERCLNSLVGIPDEIVIVDTGSTDRTKEIAKRYTQKVFDFTWVEDFAAARNFSLSKAGCDYIYVADADEVLDQENRTRFLKLKQALLPEIEVVEIGYSHQFAFNTTENFAMEYRPKLFRRLRAFQFTDPIHEVLRTDPVIFRSNVIVHHCPTSDHGGRDLAIFAKKVQKGEAFSSRLEMMYARELLIAGKKEDFEKAKPYFAMVMGEPASGREALRRAAVILAYAAVYEKDAAGLLAYAAPELVGAPPAEMCCAMGQYFYEAGDVARAADWYSAALSGAEPELIAASVGRVPLEGLAACYEAAGETEKAKEFWQQAQDWTPEMLLG